MSDLLRIIGLGRSGRLRTLIAVVFGAGATGAAVALAGVSAFLIARAAEQPPVLYLMIAIVGVRAFGISRGLLRYCERLAAHDAAFRVLGDLRVAVVRRLARLLPGGTRHVSSGDLSSRFVSEVDGLVDLWVRALVPAVVTALVATGAVVASVLVLPSAGIALALSLVVSGVLAPLAASRWSAASQRTVAADRAAYRTRLLEVLEGTAALAVDGRLDAELDELDRLDERLRAGAARTAVASGLGGALAIAGSGIAVVGALVLGAQAVRDGTLGAPGLAVVVLLPLAVHEAVGSLATVAAVLPGLRTSARRVVEVLDTPDPVPAPAAPVPVPAGPVGLELRGIRAGWPEGPDVLESFDLDLPAGSTTVVVGPSGSGKSTLAALLVRFVAARAGQVHLVAADGRVAVGDLSGDDVRGIVGWCAQDAHVFDSTVRANLLLAAPSATDDDLWCALGRAHLGEFVRSLPCGLDTLVGEHGRSLSGGERQRLALARVLLADQPVVVFDEPTEHLDDDTARSLLADLLDATQGRTTILVTHRRDLVDEFAARIDRVVALPARDELAAALRSQPGAA